MKFEIPNSEQKIIFTDDTLSFIFKFRQLDKHNKEAGGQLFATFQSGNVHVVCATGPNIKSQRNRYWYRPNLMEEKSEILNKFDNGLIFVGDWHTHPQDEPVPSEIDIKTMNECFSRSNHSLDSILLLIVGRKTTKSGIWLSQHNQYEHRRLLPIGF